MAGGRSVQCCLAAVVGPWARKRTRCLEIPYNYSKCTDSILGIMLRICGFTSVPLIPEIRSAAGGRWHHVSAGSKA